MQRTSQTTAPPAESQLEGVKIYNVDYNALDFVSDHEEEDVEPLELIEAATNLKNESAVAACGGSGPQHLKSRSLEPTNFVMGVKFWSLLPEEIKALARTKPKKQVGGTSDPLSVKHSWKYMQEVIEEAMATLDQKHTRLEWVVSVSSRVLCLCSSSDTSMKKREIEVSKYHKDGAHDSNATSGSSGASLEQLIVATDLSRDIQSMDPERVQMLTDFSRKWSEKMIERFRQQERWKKQQPEESTAEAAAVPPRVAAV
uniref:Uncharacterized protein n=1 Tax=Chromera velia CCMP2878 TaxID=1169474 RepID=A0A0G4IA46_9ALVE|eukprot:Cvel_12428.t1-p1 / transcript=Cvel_12428.t1 / gene=Cvel_12428 / organism=Chromera_velia_CCMP2878 / gene_product=hypothetical protein / transcript_product=hypothetical protein / location=Cvel_scaffold813:2111-14189(-) / protein_length=256 / sequence_SO=supercontig / SO=protein_coding / is_pseudo=false